MIAPTQIRKPENWQDFEKLCKKLWGEIWNCPDSIKRNGRSGQHQHGVDVYGKPKGESSYYGIQCKGRNDYAKNTLTCEEIDIEIEKAASFMPKLSKFIFATTANKDAKIEEYIREKDIQSVISGSFPIELYCWEDIVDLLEERLNTYNWYINNCQYKDSSDIAVYVNGKNEIEIHPEYIRMTKKYHKRAKVNPYDHLIHTTHKRIQLFNVGCDFKRKIDYRWCTIPINIKNVGSTVIEDYKLDLSFERDKIEDLDDKYRAFNSRLMDQAAVAQINGNREKQREVFESSEFEGVIEYRPLETVLVQSDHRTFEIGVKPKNNVDVIKVDWTVKSRNYKKTGELILKVVPKYDDQVCITEVEDDCDLKPDEVIIEPKIIEKNERWF
jgi:hypothetical protein